VINNYTYEAETLKISRSCAPVNHCVLNVSQDRDTVKQTTHVAFPMMKTAEIDSTVDFRCLKGKVNSGLLEIKNKLPR